VLVRLGQEVQEVPRRLAPPDEPLSDDAIRLEPLGSRFAAELEELARDDDVRRFTRAPSTPRTGFGAEWGRVYDDAWRDGSRAGFAILDAADGAFLGMAVFVTIDLDAREGEAGYILAPVARGRGVASRALALLTGWGFGGLGLHRIELRIDPANEASLAVARRNGFTHEGTLRSVHFKEDARADVSIWSRLASDPAG
jgi:RimJ/RimL family protein N-acetyltransferase